MARLPLRICLGQHCDFCLAASSRPQVGTVRLHSTRTMWLEFQPIRLPVAYRLRLMSCIKRLGEHLLTCCSASKLLAVAPPHEYVALRPWKLTSNLQTDKGHRDKVGSWFCSRSFSTPFDTRLLVVNRDRFTEPGLKSL